MKAPDKIYLAESYHIRGEVTSYFASSTPFMRHSSIAYIRKDALLEWAKGEIMPGNSAEGKGWNMAIQTLIEKIESL